MTVETGEREINRGHVQMDRKWEKMRIMKVDIKRVMIVNN